jgi:signal transduction histidine kinase
MRGLKTGILWKFLGIIITVVVAVILVVWLTIDYLAADYFSTLMEKYNISPAETHQMFLDSVHRYLLQASIAAIALAVVLSFLLTRKLLRPLSHMAEVTRQVAAGNFSARVNIASGDEVGDLARAFDSMADSLERIEQLRKTMVVDVSHELRTPLTNIRGYLEGLADGVVPPSKETYDLLLREILRMVRLVEDLNRLTKAEAARTDLRPEVIDLPELAAEILALNGSRLAARGLTLECHLSPQARRLRADRDKLGQVLHNILQNACHYADENSQVLLSSEAEPAGVRVSLVNRGEGISEQDLPFIFERFYRADKSRSRRSGGAGIGLAIVKELIEAHGGRVGARSENGETCIWFSLPA